MKYVIIGFIGLIATGCATGSFVDARRDAVLACVKDLRQTDAATLDAFEVCRQIYGLHKVKE